MIRALRPMIIKEFRQIRRDPTSLGILLVLPSALIVLVGYAVNFDVRHLSLVILDHDRTPESRTYLERYKHTEYFDHRFDVTSYAEIEQLFLQGAAKIAVVVPAGFGGDLMAGRDVALQIIVDGSDANSATKH